MRNYQPLPNPFFLGRDYLILVFHYFFMPCVDNLDTFPMIVQRRNDWCIPASIENVLGYHEFGVSQEEIFTNYGRVRDPRYMNFDTISDVLENLYGNEFDFEPEHHDNGNQLTIHVENHIQNNLPTIVSMNLPDRDRPHMYIVICMGENNVRIFDTGGAQRLVTRSRQWLIDHLSDGLGTLVIRPI